ncbi:MULTISPECIES: CapA family protein [unclassified Campylobacter]|uniref:CapA family protein n=1 Tax=unclassified Campylobacter TaxID=2593542 RepID=UPI0022E9FFCA|nr:MULTISPECIES: CapA family protein [unclassified Campylobacter]MDA3065705.1 CapA family protein [Campylobacter sp. CN_NE4]MDA3069028.1 CapA family protein [Campylobacter sp. CN_NE3]MDA3083158.1 CapA family protein [Campylobacter sp. CN_EL2]MDA3084668.1 CapA family protein [Campylobacter sp. CN_NE1]MDA3087656.1 CapA family protein [Campylobacter sp. CN_NA2]
MKKFLLILSLFCTLNADENATKKSLSLIAVGDNLIHSKIIEAGYNETNKSYDFKELYTYIKDEIKQADIKIINQETILVKDSKKYSGYPNFGTPIEVGKAVKEAGFNIIAHATNHAFDKGESGILDTAEFWSGFNDVAFAGIYASKEKSESVKIFEKNGIKVAFLNYTYGLNGHKPPKGKDYLIDLLSDEEKIKSDLEFARKNADFVVVLPHWGVEYSHKPTKEQRKKAHFLANAGADLIIGTHPHVIQPLEFITTDDNRSVPCFYSLGNFISNQEEPVRMLGAMADVKIEKEHNKTQIKSIKAEPLITHIGTFSGNFSVHFLRHYPTILEATHRLRRTQGKKMSVENLKTTWNKIFSEFSVE